MIGYISGVIRAVEEDRVVIETSSGLGYEVLLPQVEYRALFAQLPRERDDQIGQAISLFIYHYENERLAHPMLFGFRRKEDKRFFERLLDVKDIGPTSAARAMTIPVSEIAAAIERRDIKLLNTLPGIGKRKAEEIIATLKGKMFEFALMPKEELVEIQPDAEQPDFVRDTAQVLRDLGYKPLEIDRLIQTALKRKPGLDDTQKLLEEIWVGKDQS